MPVIDAFEFGIARHQQGAAVTVEQADVTAAAKTQGAQAGNRFLLLQQIPLVGVVAGSDQPVVRRKAPDVGEFFRHLFGIVRTIPAIAREAFATRFAGCRDQVAHDVAPGIVAVVEIGPTFQLRRRRQQDELALHVVDEIVAATVVETHRTQRLDDQALDLGSRTARRLAGVDRFDDLHRRIDLLGDAAPQDVLGARTGELDEALRTRHFGTEAGLDLGATGLLDARIRSALLGKVLPGKKGAKPERQDENDEQRAQQMDAGNRFLVGGQLQSCLI